MKHIVIACFTLVFAAAAAASDNGLVIKPSRHSVSETMDKLETAVKASGAYKVFLRLDHAATAEAEAGVKLRPSQLLLFGNPKGGAPLMRDSLTIGLDLPNRALVWEDADGKVYLTYNDLRQLLNRHGIKRTDEQIKVAEDRQKALFDKAVE